MRRFLLGLFAIALSVSLVACGNSEEVNVEEETNEETSEEVKEESSITFEDGKAILEDGTEVTIGTSEKDGNIVLNEVADLPTGEKILSEITYVYDGEELKEITVVMTTPGNNFAKEIVEDNEILIEGIDQSSVKVEGNKIYAKMDDITLGEMKQIPKEMMTQILVK